MSAVRYPRTRGISPREKIQQALPPEHRCQVRCEGCPFGGPRVGAKGNPEAPIVFVAESPGAEEVKSGVPLVGPSGRIFHEYVKDDGSIYILNALECKPPTSQKAKKEAIMNQAAQACHANLIEKISAHPRRLIVAMGNSAVRSLTGNFGLKITQIRGRLMDSPLAELGILPVVHVAALMRGTGNFRQWREDIEYALDMGNGGEPKKHLQATVQELPGVPSYKPSLAKIHPWDLVKDYRYRPEHLLKQDVDEVMEMITWVSRDLTADIESSGLNSEPLVYRVPKSGKNKGELEEFDRPASSVLSIGITPESDKSISYCFWEQHLPYLKRWLEDPSIKWCWHNGKFDVRILRSYGINAKVDDDTMLMSYALDESGGIHDLETVSADVLQAPDYKHMLAPYLPNKEASYDNVPPPILAKYQAIDTSNTAQVRPIYRRRIQQDPALEKLYTQTLLPASDLLTWVESNGIQVDLERLHENDDYFQEQLDRTRLQICEHVGYDINPGSPQQLEELLYNRMRLPKVRSYKETKTGEKTILALREKVGPNPLFGLILEYREAVKMRGTYVKGILKWVTPEGRVHSTYLVHGTRTGRLASREPNAQNPPRLKQIRGTFVAAPGYELLEVDLSQAELRSLATLSGDPLMVEVYNSGRDLHSELAVQLFGPEWADAYALDDPEDPRFVKAYEQRVKCKNVNFGIVYGITVYGLMDQTKLPIDECQGYLDGWYNTFNVAGDFIKMCRECPTKNRIITTCFGRKKRVGLVSRDNLNFLQNEAANFPHQSIASDINLQTGIKVAPALRSWGIKLVNLVHDSLIMEIPIQSSGHADFRKRVVEYVTGEMIKTPVEWGLTKVPFKSDAEYGDRWGSLVSYKEAA